MEYNQDLVIQLERFVDWYEDNAPYTNHIEEIEEMGLYFAAKMFLEKNK
jgi:hypothetical protein